MTATQPSPVINWDEHWNGWRYHQDTPTHEVYILPMLFNHRIILVRKGEKHTYDAGWCYPSFLSALSALVVWAHFEWDGEPNGYTKRAGA